MNKQIFFTAVYAAAAALPSALHAQKLEYEYRGSCLKVRYIPGATIPGKITLSAELKDGTTVNLGELKPFDQSFSAFSNQAAWSDSIGNAVTKAVSAGTVRRLSTADLSAANPKGAATRTQALNRASASFIFALAQGIGAQYSVKGVSQLVARNEAGAEMNRVAVSDLKLPQGLSVKQEARYISKDKWQASFTLQGLDASFRPEIELVHSGGSVFSTLAKDGKAAGQAYMPASAPGSMVQLLTTFDTRLLSKMTERPELDRLGALKVGEGKEKQLVLEWADANGITADSSRAFILSTDGKTMWASQGFQKAPASMVLNLKTPLPQGAYKVKVTGYRQGKTLELAEDRFTYRKPQTAKGGLETEIRTKIEANATTVKARIKDSTVTEPIRWILYSRFGEKEVARHDTILPAGKVWEHKFAGSQPADYNLIAVQFFEETDETSLRNQFTTGVDKYATLAFSGYTKDTGTLTLQWEVNAQAQFAGYRVYVNDKAINPETLISEESRYVTIPLDKKQNLYQCRIEAVDRTGKVVPGREPISVLTKDLKTSKR